MRQRVSFAASARVTLTALSLVLQARALRAQGEVHVSRSVLEQYEGEWVYPSGNTVMLILSGDTLFREIRGQRVPLVPMSPTRFRQGPVFTAEFVMDNAGGITQILSDGVGIEYRLTRTGSPPAALPSSSATVHVPRSVLERYVGEYEYLPGQMSRSDLKVVVRLKGDTLMRAIGAPTEDALIPISSTRFKVGNTSLVTEFVVDSHGVTQIMGTGNQQMKARLKAKF